MAAAGQGLAILPVILGAGDPRLEQTDVYLGASVPIWVASHSDLAQVARIAEARRIFCDALAEMAPRLLGAAQGAV